MLCPYYVSIMIMTAHGVLTWLQLPDVRAGCPGCVNRLQALHLTATWQPGRSTVDTLTSYTVPILCINLYYDGAWCVGMVAAARCQGRVPRFCELPAGAAPHGHLAAWQEIRSEEHTSELQSHSEISYAVFCL